MEVFVVNYPTEIYEVFFKFYEWDLSEEEGMFLYTGESDEFSQGVFTEDLGF